MAAAAGVVRCRSRRSHRGVWPRRPGPFLRQFALVPVPRRAGSESSAGLKATSMFPPPSSPSGQLLDRRVVFICLGALGGVAAERLVRDDQLRRAALPPSTDVRAVRVNGLDPRWILSSTPTRPPRRKAPSAKGRRRQAEPGRQDENEQVDYVGAGLSPPWDSGRIRTTSPKARADLLPQESDSRGGGIGSGPCPFIPVPQTAEVGKADGCCGQASPKLSAQREPRPGLRDPVVGFSNRALPRTITSELIELGDVVS